MRRVPGISLPNRQKRTTKGDQNSRTSVRRRDDLAVDRNWNDRDLPLDPEIDSFLCTLLSGIVAVGLGTRWEGIKRSRYRCVSKRK